MARPLVPSSAKVEFAIERLRNHILRSPTLRLRVCVVESSDFDVCENTTTRTMPNAFASKDPFVETNLSKNPRVGSVDHCESHSEFVHGRNERIGARNVEIVEGVPRGGNIAGAVRLVRRRGSRECWASSAVIHRWHGCIIPEIGAFVKSISACGKSRLRHCDPNTRGNRGIRSTAKVRDKRTNHANAHSPSQHHR